MIVQANPWDNWAHKAKGLSQKIKPRARLMFLHCCFVGQNNHLVHKNPDQRCLKLSRFHVFESQYHERQWSVVLISFESKKPLRYC